MFSVRTRTVLVCLIAIATASTSTFAQGGPGAQGARVHKAAGGRAAIRSHR